MRFQGFALAATTTLVGLYASAPVKDEKAAIEIALSVWIPKYGEKAISKQKPYHAELRDGVWYVAGSLPKGWRGGVAEAQISAADSTVLKVSHGR